MRDGTAETYRRRSLFAWAASLVLHGLALAYVFLAMQSPADRPAAPIVLTLERTQPPPSPVPEPPPGPKAVVDAVNPTDGPVAPTDLIAEQNSRAADFSNAEGAANAPHVDKLDEFDDSGAAKGKAAPPATAPPPKKIKEKTKRLPQENEEKKKAATKPAQPAVVPAPTSANGMEEAPPAEPKPVQVAQAGTQLPQLPATDLRPRNARGRVTGGVKNAGFLGFEAMQDEMAPYLKEIRKRVERNWYAAIEMRYTGAMPTRAVVDCVIAPEGRLVDVRIVEPGTSITYAPLCREAIERAAPFPAFPFKVPDIYADKNLEIRWTFGFLMH